MFGLYGEGDYQGALSAVEAEIDNIDSEDLPIVVFWRICLLSRVG